MKKKIIILLTIIIVLINTTALAVGNNDTQLTDIQDHWAKDTITQLIGLGVINGYEDGTFRPENTVQVDEFIKMTVTSLGHELENGTSYWASTYIDKAKTLGLVKNGEYTNYTRPITRAEMARIIVRALDEEYPDNLDEYKSLITDYNAIEDNYKDYIVKAYCKGIITGYEDGSFKGKQNATRAESATMIVRMLDEEKRIIPELKDEEEQQTNDDTEPLYMIASETGERQQVETPYPQLIPHIKRGMKILGEGEGYAQFSFYPQSQVYMQLFEKKEDVESPIWVQKPTLISYYFDLDGDATNKRYYPYNVAFYNIDNAMAREKFAKIVEDIAPEAKDLIMGEFNKKLTDNEYGKHFIEEINGRRINIKTSKMDRGIYLYIGLKVGE